MKLLLVAGGVAAVVLVLIAATLRPRRGVALGAPWPLEKNPTLLTAAEQILCRRLVTALPDHVVFAQVQLLQAVRFTRGTWTPAILNRIS